MLKVIVTNLSFSNDSNNLVELDSCVETIVLSQALMCWFYIATRIVQTYGYDFKSHKKYLPTMFEKITNVNPQTEKTIVIIDMYS